MLNDKELMGVISDGRESSDHEGGDEIELVVLRLG